MGKKVLLIGSRGMLGRELAALLGKHKFDVTEWDLADIDIADKKMCEQKIPPLSPDIIINAAAYTNVDGAETEKKDAFAINRDGPKNLAEIAKETGAKLIHYSTDYIFDGKKKTPYSETDKPKPLSVYGQSKLAGEEGVREACDDYLIIRAEWLYGRHGKNFVQSIISAASQKTKLEVVNDQRGSPTYAFDLAEATLFLIKKNANGIVNFTSSGNATWYDFAILILKELGIDSVEVVPISSTKLKLPAKRPENSQLDCSLYKKITGKTPPDWKKALNRYMKTVLLK
jgi:dTDP-4-dehydrorhamnose reductase